MGLGIISLIAFPERVVSLTKPYEEVEFLQQPDPVEVSKLYQEWLLTKKANQIKGTYGGQCVTFARNFTGMPPELVSGIAKNIPTNSQTPEIGAIIKTNESKYGHLAVIIGIEGENLTLVESNYSWDSHVSVRVINASDKRILGYIIKTN